jgi:hypothetical protein
LDYKYLWFQSCNHVQFYTLCSNPVDVLTDLSTDESGEPCSQQEVLGQADHGLGHGASPGTCCFATSMSLLANLLKPRLPQSRTTVIIPLHKRVVFVRFLNCSEFPSRLSEISQALDTITGIEFRVGSAGLDERWPLGTVNISSCSGV